MAVRRVGGAVAPDEAARSLAELADLILNVGRLLRSRTPAEADGVPLTETERTVMRVIDLFPGSSPSAIAERAQLQRTNVSAALRSLEGKRLLTRTATTGRGVAVHPTELAAANLAVLRGAWARQLTDPLGDDLAGIRASIELLERLEQRLVDPDAVTGS